MANVAASARLTMTVVSPFLASASNIKGGPAAGLLTSIAGLAVIVVASATRLVIPMPSPWMCTLLDWICTVFLIW